MSTTDSDSNSPEVNVSPVAEGAQSGCFGCFALSFPFGALIGLCTWWPGLRYLAYPTLLFVSIVWVRSIGRSAAVTGSNTKEDAALRGSLAGPVAVFIVGIGALLLNGQFWAIDFNEKKEQERIAEEARENRGKTARAFEKRFTSEASNISATYRESSETSAGFLWIANNTQFDWASVHLVANPQMDGIIGKLSFDYVAEVGFRFPVEGAESLATVVRGDQLAVPLSDFIHTETEEKFSTDRYRLKKLFVSMEIEYEGEQFRKSVVIEPTVGAASSKVMPPTKPAAILTAESLVGEWKSDQFGNNVTIRLLFEKGGSSFGWGNFEGKPEWAEAIRGSDYKGRWGVSDGELRMKSIFGNDYILPVIDQNDGAWTMIPSTAIDKRTIKLDFGGSVGVQVFRKTSP
ncbi:hypothetical protein [Rosistilla oblonga]|uniref:hypothetical protein n=1 Tax=Rosistilla oblonga TaxID=2527990 RepID=UPI003A97C042